jgi:hypothetical protein
MNQITKTSPETARADSASLISVIARAAENPDVDIEKMERLFAMHERMQLSAARTSHMAALTQMQAEIPTHIEERGGIKDKNQRVQSSYALWEDVNQAIRPVLHRHGFALTFRTSQEAHSITITGVLSHEAGHCEMASITLPHDGSGSKNAVQAIASSITYGKRYTAGELLNFTSGKDEADDDGKAAGSATITDSQAMMVRDLIEQAEADMGKLLAFAGAENVEAISPAKLQTITENLRRKIDAKRVAAEQGAE